MQGRRRRSWRKCAEGTTASSRAILLSTPTTSATTRCGKFLFVIIVVLKTINSPRQTRDKNEDKLSNRGIVLFCRAPSTRAVSKALRSSTAAIFYGTIRSDECDRRTRPTSATRLSKPSVRRGPSTCAMHLWIYGSMDLFLPINYRRIVYFLRLADGALCVGVGLRLPPDLDDQMSGWLIEVCNNDPFSQFPCGKTTTCQDRLGKTHQDSLKTGSFLTHAGFFTGQHSDRRADGHHGRRR
jgi:hypothetical protein